MPKLTDSQLVILSAAAAREDGAALPLPTSLRMKGAAATKTLDGLRRKALLAERPAARDDTVWREDENGRPMMLVVTEAGLSATDGDPAKEKTDPSRRIRKQAKEPRARRSTAGSPPRHGTAPTARTGTKQALLISLLERKDGATIEEVSATTGWQAHSVRGAISGTLRKKLGLAIKSEPVEGRGRVYRITGRG